MAFPSRFPGVCKRCGQPFPAGTMISWSRRHRNVAYHEICPGRPVPQMDPDVETPVETPLEDQTSSETHVDPTSRQIDKAAQLAKLLFALAHPAMVRIGLFRAGARLWGDETLHANREGGTNPWTATIALPRIKEDDANWASPQAVEAWIKAQYEAIQTGVFA